MPQRQFRIVVFCVATGTYSITSPYVYDDRSQHVSGSLLPEAFFNQFAGVSHKKRGCVTERVTSWATDETASRSWR